MGGLSSKNKQKPAPLVITKSPSPSGNFYNQTSRPSTPHPAYVEQKSAVRPAAELADVSFPSVYGVEVQSAPTVIDEKTPAMINQDDNTTRIIMLQKEIAELEAKLASTIQLRDPTASKLSSLFPSKEKLAVSYDTLMQDDRLTAKDALYTHILSNFIPLGPLTAEQESHLSELADLILLELFRGIIVGMRRQLLIIHSVVPIAYGREADNLSPERNLELNENLSQHLRQYLRERYIVDRKLPSIFYAMGTEIWQQSCHSVYGDQDKKPQKFSLEDPRLAAIRCFVENAMEICWLSIIGETTLDFDFDHKIYSKDRWTSSPDTIGKDIQAYIIEEQTMDEKNLQRRMFSGLVYPALIWMGANNATKTILIKGQVRIVPVDRSKTSKFIAMRRNSS